MKKIFLVFIFFIISVVVSCGIKEEKIDTSEFKYIITHGEGFQEKVEYAVSEIEYLPNGCIKFLGFAWGSTDTTIVCGNFVIKSY